MQYIRLGILGGFIQSVDVGKHMVQSTPKGSIDIDTVNLSVKEGSD